MPMAACSQEMRQGVEMPPGRFRPGVFSDSVIFLGSSGTDESGIVSGYLVG